MSSNAKILWKTQKTPTKHALRHLKKFLKIRFFAEKIRFSAQMSNNAKIPWNTQKTPTKYVLRLLEKFLKIRFSAEKSGSRPRFRTMLKYHETLRNHQLNMFWGFLRNFWKSGSRPRFRTMLKYYETLRNHQLNMFWGFLRNFWKSGFRLKHPVRGSDVKQC